MQEAAQAANYIADVCSELAKLASGWRLHTLQYLLTVANLEASQQVKANTSTLNCPFANDDNSNG